MAELIKRAKALSVKPLKSSQTIGAALAFLGLKNAIPMLHGSQGCTAFGKVFFVRHFREPIPLQTTAMDQVSTVMGSQDNVIDGLAAICKKSKPAVIGLPSTGLSETQGADVRLAIREFRTQHPEFADTEIVPVDTPDFTGCLETGYAKAVDELILALAVHMDDKDESRVNILAGAHLTPGDIEAVKDMVELFGLTPVVIPDISGSLDGHLGDKDFAPLTTGGATVDVIRTLGGAKATIVIGAALSPAADRLGQITGVPDYRFDHLLGLKAVDAFVLVLSQISGQAVPAKLERQRTQVQDAMLDAHFMIGQARVAIAADPDLLKTMIDFVQGMGAEVVVAVSPAGAKSLKDLPVQNVKIGDLEDLEKMAFDGGAELVIGNSHCVQSAEALGVPVLRAGFPQFDIVGGFRKTWMGYAGTRDALFDVANLMLSTHKGEVEPYASIYANRPAEKGPADKGPGEKGEGNHVHRATSSGSGLRH
ncbi:nitrogenase iron-molybdenum cofactor biosynthesis protein NifN [Magnetovibrio blakemorei]|uniref:Nitrogenase iron-molybdenum cofactor biosynthesis protein NifN n=1 Tax=Magnetovibrio blakemorei TaxID=28181 RepID=A0A1E5Q685_9PROT|nr:nitrogenase iron-molybdenum cofactor biosynthesis protein NifN [Magnetovibrio blakemorei]OEJ66247.1 nitrogenase iron-molybdenum cofactor biosynthesis protein NifN [Magnetovibrio blakemorei]